MRSLFLLVVIASLGGSLGCGAAQPRHDGSGAGGGDGEALIACWRDAIGGTARLAAIQSVEREARTESDQLTGTRHSWSRADGAYREEATLGPSSDVTVYAGGHAWSRAGLSAPFDVAHQELAELKTAAYLESFAPLVAGRMTGRARPGPQPHSLVEIGRAHV